VVGADGDEQLVALRVDPGVADGTEGVVPDDTAGAVLGLSLNDDGEANQIVSAVPILGIMRFASYQHSDRLHCAADSTRTYQEHIYEDWNGQNHKACKQTSLLEAKRRTVGTAG
jgi:hypothetical protein